MSKRFSPARRAALSAAGIALPAICPGQHVIEEVEVVGTPHGHSPAELAQSVSVLGGEELERAQGTNLGETLAGELGISASHFGSGASRPIIRGLAGGRVKVMEDGVDALDVSTVSADHAVGIDPLAAEQIEIFRGPTTLLYGSGAVGGVVNTVTRRIPGIAPEDGVEAAVELRADTVADARSAAARVDGGGEGFAWHFDGVRRRAGDYDIPGVVEPDAPDEVAVEGFVPNSGFSTSAGAAGASWLGERAAAGAAVSGFQTGYGLPGHGHHEPAHDEADEAHEDAEHEEDGHDHAADERVRVDLDQRRVDVRAEWLGASRFPEIVFRLGVNDYEHVELEGDDAGTLFTNDAYEGRIEVLHEPWGEWTGVFGAQFGEREFSAIGDEAFVPPVRTRSAGVFMLEHRELGRWEVSLGGRVERVRHAPRDGAEAVEHSAGSLSAALIRELAPDLAFTVNAVLAERVPTAEELYSNGPHLASNAFEVGDPGLGVETARHFDAGVRRTAGAITGSLTAFHTRYDDFIYLGATGEHAPASELAVFAYLQRGASLTGFEAELFATVAQLGGGEIDLRIFSDYVEAELDGGEALPRIPPRRYGVRVQFHDERFTAGLEATRHEDQERTAPFETPTAGYTLLGADFEWTLRPDGSRPIDLFFKASNLLDEDARRHSSMVKDLAPLPGRNYALGVRASFR